MSKAIDAGTADERGARPLDLSLSRPLWYMGVKARVLQGGLARLIEEEVPAGRTVVDLMSGTGIVSAFAADRYRVYANDSQLYACLIAKSLIEHDPSAKQEFLDSVDPGRDLTAVFERNLEALTARYERPLRVEESLLERFRSGERGSTWCRDYRLFLQARGSIYGCPHGPARGGDLFAGARELLDEEAIARFRVRPMQWPACLVTAYYANVYFGLKQSIVIDSLRAAIASMVGKTPLLERKLVHYLSALLHAVSFSTSGTSHFAQPRHLTKDSELAAMANRRQIDIRKRFVECSRDIVNAVSRIHYRPGNRCFLGDYRLLVKESGAGGDSALPGPARFVFPSTVDLVYLDPPYTADNYSRFYHVLDVLALYDYPPLDRDSRGRVLRGRYPRIERRFQSGFCQKGKVEAEFRRVIHAAAGAGSKLVISYASPSGLLLKEYARRFPGADPVRRLEGLCREAYHEVETRRLSLMHSGQGDSNIPVEELLVVCRRPRGK